MEEPGPGRKGLHRTTIYRKLSGQPTECTAAQRNDGLYTPPQRSSDPSLATTTPRWTDAASPALHPKAQEWEWDPERMCCISERARAVQRSLQRPRGRKQCTYTSEMSPRNILTSSFTAAIEGKTSQGTQRASWVQSAATNLGHQKPRPATRATIARSTAQKPPPL